jgi:NCS1 family nucleobase:cation symporter-1
VLCVVRCLAGKILPQEMNKQLVFEEMVANESFFDHESIGTTTGVLDGEGGDVVTKHYYVAEGKDNNV